jgi:hypothetical protein
MELEQGTIVGIVIAITSVVGNIFIALRQNILQLKITKETQTEERRTLRYGYLVELMKHLLEASRKYQAFLGMSEEFRNSGEGQRELSETIGEAINACLATGDEELRIIAEGDKKGHGLTYARLKKGENGSVDDYLTRNREGLFEAIKRMSQLIIEVGN